ncbi:MAG: hypothetical protein J7539_01650 [Niabella sp.]|nr:hypothetical protein [Niabella sp.]
MNFNGNIRELINQAHEYQYKEIGAKKEENEKNKPKFYFTKKQWVILFIAISMTIIFQKSFSENFCGYIISALSLFIGLLFTFLIALYDKFKNTEAVLQGARQSRERANINRRLINFFKKITVLTLYETLIALLCILLLALNLLTNYCSFDIAEIRFEFNLNLIDIPLTIRGIVTNLYKIITLYFLLNFLLIVVYIISSFYDFMIGEYKKLEPKKIDNL